MPAQWESLPTQGNSGFPLKDTDVSHGEDCSPPGFYQSSASDDDWRCVRIAGRKKRERCLRASVPTGILRAASVHGSWSGLGWFFVV
ncbi:MAG: hypothetical protein DRH24_19815 [Deltaproteobacteria bacterium]|nr:MAG: hypothetical protein DRH24_19815 [Deltaproteobacteria bacterium]